MKTYELNNLISFYYPNNWIVEVDEKLVSVYDQINGVGALQLTIYEIHNNDEIDLLKEFTEFINERHIDFDVNNKGECLYSEISDEDIWWRYWLLKNGNVLIFATYNCDIPDKGKEDMIVDKIVKSALR
jgi:hypothetical protein